MRSATESIAEFACDSGIAGGFAGGLGCSWAACETSSLLWARACAFGPGGGFGIVELLGAVELNDGAVAGGSSGTGFCAVWQAQPARVSPSRIATRIWMSTTRIFIYEIQRWQLKPGTVSKIVSGEPLMVNLSKGLYQVTFGIDSGYRRRDTVLNQTAKPGERFDPYEGFPLMRRPLLFVRRSDQFSNAPVIGTPVLDRLLDIGGHGLAAEGALHQTRALAI